MMLALCGAACSEQPSATAPFAHVFDACAPLGLAAPAATAAQLAMISDAKLLWSDVGITGPEELGAGVDDSVRVTFVAAAPGVFGFYDDDVATIDVSQELTPAQAQVVIAHELGHAFGLVHVPREERLSVMNAGNLSIAPTDADRSAVADLWGDCSDQ